MFTVLSLTTLIIVVSALRALSKEAKAQAEIQAEMLDLRAVIACKEAYSNQLESELKEMRENQATYDFKLELYSSDLDVAEAELVSTQEKLETCTSELESYIDKHYRLSEAISEKIADLRDGLDELECEND